MGVRNINKVFCKVSITPVVNFHASFLSTDAVTAKKLLRIANLSAPFCFDSGSRFIDDLILICAVTFWLGGCAKRSFTDTPSGGRYRFGLATKTAEELHQLIE